MKNVMNWTTHNKMDLWRTTEVFIRPQTIIEVNQLCQSFYLSGDNVDVIVISEHAFVANIEVKGQVLSVIQGGPSLAETLSLPEYPSAG